MKFEMRYVYEFCPGEVNGSTEPPPPDIFGEIGRNMELGCWPATGTVFVEAATLDGAVRQAEAMRQGCLAINTKIGEDRFWELAYRRRPGTAVDLYSVVGFWTFREEGTAQWHHSAQPDHPIRKA